HQRPHSPAGWLPQFALQSRCGSLPASEYPTSEAAFASRLAPTDYATKPLWEACLQANTPIRGRIRQQAGSHRLRYEAAVGSLLASEYPTSEVTFASRQAPTVCATKPLWELACKQASHGGYTGLSTPPALGPLHSLRLLARFIEHFA